MVAILGKTLYYLELLTALFSLTISIYHFFSRKPVAGVGRPPSLYIVVIATVITIIVLLDITYNHAYISQALLP